MNYYEYFKKNEEGVLHNIARMLASETIYSYDKVRNAVDKVAAIIDEATTDDPEEAIAWIIKASRQVLVIMNEEGRL